LTLHRLARAGVITSLEIQLHGYTVSQVRHDSTGFASDTTAWIISILI